MLRLLTVVALVGLSYGALDDKITNQLNQQIMYELRASYFYQAYSHFFERADVALPGFAKWFAKASEEERDHANYLLEYLNKRGVDISLSTLVYRGLCKEIAEHIPDRDGACICLFMAPKTDYDSDDDLLDDSVCNARTSWKNGLWALEDALALEIKVNDMLLTLHKNANDPHLSHVLEHQYLDEQVESIKKISDMITQLKRADGGLGEYLFDQQLQ